MKTMICNLHLTKKILDCGPLSPTKLYCVTYNITLESAFKVSWKKFSKVTQVGWSKMPSSICNSKTIIIKRLAHIMIAEVWFWETPVTISFIFFFLPNTMIWYEKSNWYTHRHRLSYFILLPLLKAFVFLKMWFSTVWSSRTMRQGLLGVSWNQHGNSHSYL